MYSHIKNIETQMPSRSSLYTLTTFPNDNKCKKKKRKMKTSISNKMCVSLEYSRYIFYHCIRHSVAITGAQIAETTRFTQS